MMKTIGHNKLYYETENRIKSEYVKLLKTGKMPTMEEVASNLGLTRKTVSRHLNAIDLSELTSPFRLFGADVINALKDKALEGDERSARLFFLLTFDIGDKKEIKADVDIKAKVKKEVKVKVSPKVAKLIGDILVKEVSEE